MADSPTTRTLRECRKRAWQADVTERWIAGARIRRDLFHFGDVLALDGQPGSLAIQACAGASHAARRAKITSDPEVAPKARAWLEAGNRIAVWSWAKRGERGKRKLWTLREDEILLTNIDPHL